MVGAYCIRPTKYHQRLRKLSCFHPLRGRGVGVCNTPLQSGTCDSSKYRCNSSTRYVLPFKKLSRFRPLRGRLWDVSHTPLRPGTCDPSKYRCNFPTGYVQLFEKQSRFRPLRARAVGRIRYAPTTGYVRFFEIPMRSSDWVRVRVQKWICIRHRRWRMVGVFNMSLRPGRCAPSKYRCNSPTGHVRSFKIPA